MKARIILLSTTFLAIVMFNGCNSDDEFAVVLRGDEKLSQGTTVPFRLEQNYPNPFNPSTSIRWAVASTLHIRLRVLTEDWHEVATLVYGIISPGVYINNFDARDLASGVYYYVMEGGGFTEIRAMRLVK